MLPYAMAGCHMAGTTTNELIAAGSAIATAEEVQAVFNEHARELIWLAEFLTDDELLASACVEDAGHVSENNKEDEICQECAQSWSREATVRSALDVKRMRIAELAPVYEWEETTGRPPAPLSSESVELLVRESDVIRRRLDSLCRFVLILCGVEHHSARDVARLLGIRRHAVEAAYISALQLLEAIYCQAVLEAYGCPAA